MPGYIVAAQMKQIEPDVPILLVSGDGPMPQDRLTPTEAFLPKSEPLAVLATIKHLLARSQKTAHAMSCTAAKHTPNCSAQVGSNQA